jgi:hypothetical protein
VSHSPPISSSLIFLSKILKLLIMQFFNPHVISSTLGPNSPLRTLFLNILNAINQVSRPYRTADKIINLWLYSPCGPWRFFSFFIYTQSVGLLRWRISPSLGHYLHTEQHKHRINAQDIHASSGIRNHDPSV